MSKIPTLEPKEQKSVLIYSKDHLVGKAKYV